MLNCYTKEQIENAPNGYTISIKGFYWKILAGDRIAGSNLGNGEIDLIVKECSNFILNRLEHNSWTFLPSIECSIRETEEPLNYQFGYMTHRIREYIMSGFHKRSCECGSHTTSFPQYHSEWCPEYTELVIENKEQE